MADTKEVLDYLRNQQKAAEIEAKMDGVNVWVLLGAIAVVGWQLTASPVARLWNDQELVLRTLVAVVALHMLSWLIRRSGRAGDDLRYSTSNFVDIESPYLVLLKGVLLLAPPASLIYLAGKSIGTLALSVLGLVYVALSVVELSKPLLATTPAKERFPKPEFGLSRRAQVIIDLVFGSLFFAAIAEQVAYVNRLNGGLSIEEARQIMLLAVFYLLIIIVVGRRLQNDSIAWTYEMETDLVVGAISPGVAVRKIENRRLGPRLQDVVDRFFDELDERFSALDSMLEECLKKVASAKQVPEEYPAERASRLQEASAGVTKLISEISTDCKDFRTYLAKPEPKLKGNSQSVLASLTSRHESYEKRARAAKLKLDRMIS